MSQKPGRNQPCWCGSGTKYKKCCLAKDEEAARAAAVQAAPFDDSDLPWDDPYLDDDDRDEDFDLDLGTITRVCYTRGMVNSIADLRAGRGVRITEWSGPGFPARLLETIEDEDLAQLVGRWGDHTLGEPIQVDIIDIETDMDLLTIEAFNRGVALFTVPDDPMLQIHRACEALERLAMRSAPIDLESTAIRSEESDDERTDDEERG